MKGFILSLRSEFYKSRKTLGFWCSIILPLVICLLVFVGYLTHSDKMGKMPGQLLWMSYASIILGVMGSLLLPIYVIIIGYSVNSIEHKADTWKTLFSLPISKWSVYAAKFVYALFLVFMCLLLFYVFTIASGNLLSTLKPELKFNEFHMESFLGQVYLKLFLASLGILSLQFLLSLVWADFLKPMGIGFLGTIAGMILVGVKWEYNYWIPYAHPLLAINGLFKQPKTPTPAPPTLSVELFTNEIYVSLGIAVVFFIAGFFIVQKKSVK
ncbi:MAG: ABC transporter permease [Mucilaginibacter sp.]|uniref:ABC transporter permease n=1 Tax=Mucilaginibacter sp. TaxID=1882438 RepID=UPI0032660962